MFLVWVTFHNEAWNLIHLYCIMFTEFHWYGHNSKNQSLVQTCIHFRTLLVSITNALRQDVHPQIDLVSKSLTNFSETLVLHSTTFSDVWKRGLHKMAPTDKGKSLPKSSGPRASIYAQKLSTLKKTLSPSGLYITFQFFVPTYGKRGIGSNCKTGRPSVSKKGFLSRHFGILYAQLLFRLLSDKEGRKRG